MDDRTLYATILGIAAPWDVARVQLDDTAKAVHVWLEERSGTAFACRECATISPPYDHVERSWRHLDTCQYETRLHARVPRIECREHGVKPVPVPWATAHSRFTVLFERLAIAWLKEATPAAVARRLGLTQIVFDKFHVMRHVTEAMDQVRRREQGELRARGDRRLTGTKFLWLKTHVGRRDFTAEARRQFRARCARRPSGSPLRPAPSRAYSSG
jgi:transposase